MQVSLDTHWTPTRTLYTLAGFGLIGESRYAGEGRYSFLPTAAAAPTALEVLSDTTRYASHDSAGWAALLVAQELVDRDGNIQRAYAEATDFWGERAAK